MATRTINSMLWTVGCIVLFALIFASTPAAANGPFCAQRAKLIEGLSAKFQESRKGVGITGTGTGALEVYASEEGTWTIVVTTTRGKTCILASGHSWQTTPKAAVHGPGA